MIVWRTVDKGELEPDFADDVEELLHNSKWTWYVTSGFRSHAAQDILYGQGRSVYQLAQYNLTHVARPDLPRVTNARAGQSAHNYGLAIDVVPDGDDNVPGLQPIWNVKLPPWLWLKQATLKHPRLKGGWSFNDWPHIERYKWYQYTNWRKPSWIV
jgi:peptidoglycan LD-endopeptidase CwlK